MLRSREIQEDIAYNSANVATFNTAPGNKRYTSFLTMFANVDKTIPKNFRAFNTSVVTNDKDDRDTEDDNSKDASTWTDADDHSPDPVPEPRKTETLFQQSREPMQRVKPAADVGYTTKGNNATSFHQYEGCNVVQDDAEDVVSAKLGPSQSSSAGTTAWDTHHSPT